MGEKGMKERLTFYDDSGNPCYRTKEYSSFFGKEIDVVISGSDVARKLAEYEDADEQGLLTRLPCKVGGTVYHICKCKDIPTQLDGTMYGTDGGYGTATGYYCPYKDNCPHDTDGCDLCKDTMAIFEDVVTGIYICEEYNSVQLENTPSIYFPDFGKTVFLTREQAERALKNMEGNI